MGRPSIQTDDVCATICDRIAMGESLRAICREEGMPAQATVLRWLSQDDAFRGQYARARDDQADFHADEIVEIADNEPDPQKARVRVDARKWVAAKLKPKKYGDRLDIEQNTTVAHYVVEVPALAVDVTEWLNQSASSSGVPSLVHSQRS